MKEVLFVDDDPDITLIVSYIIRKMDYVHLTTASTGKEALELMKEKLFDLILLDVMMPELDGVSTFHALRKLPGYKETPVLFVTAKVQRDEVEAYKNLGVQDVVSKPFDPIELPKIVRKWLK
ncbi:MAG: response regulator [Chlamydiia bacterium]|nr:response regulator [Chlamydiia bacterium]